MIEDGFGGFLVLLVLLAAVMGFVYWRARKQAGPPVTKYPPANVPRDRDGDLR